MSYYQPFQITAFHSCDKEVALKVLSGKEQLKPSNNDWDWLGEGVYFWEDNPVRAFQYADECSKGKQKNKKRIKTPFVIGAVIELGRCLNLVEPEAMSIVKESHLKLKQTLKKAKQKLPKNKDANRALDCAVFRYLDKIYSDRGKSFDTIRCPLQEGKTSHPGSNFSVRQHIEICVLNHDSIVGYFLPRPIDFHNPHLGADPKFSLEI